MIRNALRLAVLTLVPTAAFAQAAAPAVPSVEAPRDTLAQSSKDINDRLKFSGYIQGRFSYDERSTEAAVNDGFSVRRGRLKASYDADWTRYVLELDASSKSVSLKDAEFHLVEQWTPYKFALVAGQTRWSFGHEVSRSHSELEFPEMTRATQSFMPGERDRGAKVLANVGALRFAAGVFDGNGTSDKTFVNVDNDRNKDVIGRLGIDLKWISGGVSGWYGRTWRPAVTTGLVPVEGAWFSRNRIGADLQVKGNMLPLGTTTLRAEFLSGRTYWKDNVEQYGLPGRGGYVLLSQGLGELTSVALRYDRFDPLAGTGAKAASSDPTLPAATNAVNTYGVAVSRVWSRNLKLTAAYEIPVTETTKGTSDPKDNLLTLQAQVKF